MERVKTADQMNKKEIRRMCRMFAGTFMIIWPWFTFMITSSDKRTYFVHSILMGILLESVCLCSMILSKYDRFLLKAFYWGDCFVLFLSMWIFYLCGSGNFMEPHASVSIILIFINPVILVVLLLVRRVVFSNPKFVNAIKDKKQAKYILCDTVTALIVGAIVLAIAKACDTHPLGTVSSSLAFIIGFPLFLMTATATSFVYSSLSYYYVARYRKDIVAHTKQPFSKK